MDSTNIDLENEFQIRKRLFNLIKRENEAKKERTQLIYDVKRMIVDNKLTIEPSLLRLILNP